MYPKIPQFSGPNKARVLILGEAPGQNEVLQRKPFVGMSGQELDRMLHEAGFLRSECRIGNVCPYQPFMNKIDNFFYKKSKAVGSPISGKYPSAEIREGLLGLEAELKEHKPELIIALGNTALWALTGNWGITKWRGSQLYKGDIKVVPTYHPAAILRTWSDRYPAVQDLRRAKMWLDGKLQAPQWNFILAPTFEEVAKTLKAIKDKLTNEKEVKLAVDIETRAGHIACCGIAWSATEAMCIPLMSARNPEGYFSLEEEWYIVCAMREVLEHPNAVICGQNFLYDSQYFIRWWQAWPNCKFDTMLAHHCCFPGTPKGLDYLSSIYCQYHVYWKDEGKNFDPRYHSEEQLWRYNCIDCVRTFEVATVEEANIKALGLETPWQFQCDMYNITLEMMVRGVLFDVETQSKYAVDLLMLEFNYGDFFEGLIGRHVQVKSKKAAPWYTSPKQQMALFYNEFGCKPVIKRQTKRPTVDDQALTAFANEKPILTPLCKALQEYRSVGVYRSTFLLARADEDSRMRSYFNPAGTETFRYSSSKNAFGSGMNLQNLPGQDEEAETREFPLPNIRSLFLPDPGYIIAEFDLKQADAQVVAAEAADAELLAMFRDPKVDVHAENAKVIFGGCTGKHDTRRQKAKQGVHLTNYGGTARVLAITLGITMREAEFFQSRWFAAHPRIKHWHRDIEQQLAMTRTVQNRFGNRRFYFDRIQDCFKEALAWIPQSTVALVINRIIKNIVLNAPEVKVLLQVHDSAVIEFPCSYTAEQIEKLKALTLVPIPYEPELIIATTMKSSLKSWGDCE